MSNHNHELRRLREALLDSPPASDGEPGAVDPARTWEAVHGELPKEELLELAALALTSPRAMEEWRLALATKRENEREVSQTPTAIPRKNQTLPFPTPRPVTSGRTSTPAITWWDHDSRKIATIAAFGILLAILLGLMQLKNSQDRWRGQGGLTITKLSRSRCATAGGCILAWEGPTFDEVTSYTLSASNGYRWSYTKTGLQERSFQIPAEELAGLDPKEPLLWTVEALLSDGTTVESAVFKTSL